MSELLKLLIDGEEDFSILFVCFGRVFVDCSRDGGGYERGLGFLNSC